ncbi:hypothetical protein HAZT_HAZT011239 [Hyalella azteca]|uniref:Uncharacterized protein n=1 Tax=Hyalella azteca TaxID=294128 RepID=A0A6A0GPU3_HYAAZ|nr:hypothetical protein HAZT_HAZT011239 [Hyalella azteca]
MEARAAARQKALEIEKKKADVRKRLEESSQKKAKKGFMTPERKKKLRLLLRKKAAEELKKEQERKAAERRKIIDERCGQPKNLDGANEGKHNQLRLKGSVSLKKKQLSSRGGNGSTSSLMNLVCGLQQFNTYSTTIWIFESNLIRGRAATVQQVGLLGKRQHAREDSTICPCLIKKLKDSHPSYFQVF